MKARIVKIGNSRGIRIPKGLIEQSGLTGDVDITVDGNRIILSPADGPRAGWDEAFRAMAESGDDTLLDQGGPAPAFDRDEWQW